MMPGLPAGTVFLPSDYHCGTADRHPMQRSCNYHAAPYEPFLPTKSHATLHSDESCHLFWTWF